jgi:hypothetical protein
MSSPVRHELTEYAAGRGNAERLVQVVAEAFYREEGRGKGEGLRPIIELVERVAPGVVELARTELGPGFAVRLAERPFPARYEEDLRKAVEQTLARLPAETLPPSPIPRPPSPGLFRRILGALQRLFT